MFISLGWKLRGAIAGSYTACIFTLLGTAWLVLASGPPKRGGMGNVGKAFWEERRFKDIEQIHKLWIIGMW